MRIKRVKAISLIACLLIGGYANAKVTQRDRVMNSVKDAVTSVSTVKPTPLKTKFKASVENETEILFEDFSGVPDGAQETIGTMGDRYTDLIASHDVDPGRYINTDYTPNSGTWEGDNIFAGKGGNIVMQCNNPSQASVLRTPLGDYSGDITIQVRCRFATPFYGYENEWGYVTTYGTQLSCRAGVGGYDTNSDATTDITGYSLNSELFYESEGWNLITFKLRNESANRDGFIEFICMFALEIDWIKITDAGTYLAAPVVDPVTDFYEDGFTISWAPVRHSFDYYIDLWKMEYTSESAAYAIDFEDASALDGWTTSDCEIIENSGEENSRSLKFNTNGEDGAFVTPTYTEKIASLSYSAKFEISDEEALNGYGIYGMMFVDGLGDNGWEPITDADMYCDGNIIPGGKYYQYTIKGESFSDKYYAVRFYQYGVLSDNYLTIDNVNVQLQRPYELVRLVGEENGAIRDTENDDANYNRYHFTNSPYIFSYTFTDLDPEGEYYYRVRSHNVSEFAGTEKHHALGIASPALLPATKVKEDGFTANWEEVTKADSYIVSNYKLTTVENDENDYVILKETFSNCKGGDDYMNLTSLDNVTEGYLDEYTDMPGWTGQNNYVGDGLIGGSWYTDTKLITPPLSIDPDKDVYKVYLEAYGQLGDYLYIGFEKAGIYTIIKFTGSMISGDFEVPATNDGERLMFYSYNFLPYALNHLEVSQAKSKGDIVRTYDGTKTVPSGTDSLEFSNMEKGAMYEYSVKAVYEFESQTVYSKGNDVVRVNLADYEHNGVSAVYDNVYEVGRYDLNGISVDKDYTGFVIIRMSDGSYVKKISK